MSETTKRSDNEEYVVEINFKVEVELPVLNKAFLCVPLRPGLIAWGCVHLIATLVITCLAITSMDMDNALALVFFICFYILEIFICLSLITGMGMGYFYFVEIVYHYFKFKIPVILVILIIDIIVKLCGDYNRYWYLNNLDPWSYIIFFENQALGCLVLAAQFYLFILVRSKLVTVDHPINLVTLFQRICKDFSNLPDNDELPHAEDPNSLESAKLITDKETKVKTISYPASLYQKFCTHLDNLLSNDEKPQTNENPKQSTKMVKDHEMEPTVHNSFPKNVTGTEQTTKIVVDHDNDHNVNDSADQVETDSKLSIKIDVDPDISHHNTNEACPK